MADIELATTDAEILRCFPVMHELRPHLTPEDFVARVALQREEGYRLARLQRDGEIHTLAGFRIQHMLWSDRTLYVDDLVTADRSRSHGYGKQMLDWLVRYAREHTCQNLSLDSGTHRQDAHAFYLRERLRITSFHFVRKL